MAPRHVSPSSLPTVKMGSPLAMRRSSSASDLERNLSSVSLQTAKSSRHPLRTLRHALQDVPALSRLNKVQLAHFARDIWAIAIGIRGAVLVDIVQLQRNDLEDLMAAVQHLDFEAVQDVGIIYEESCQQTFIFNRLVMEDRVGLYLKGRTDRLGKCYVRIDTEKPVLRPEDFQPRLKMAYRLRDALVEIQQKRKAGELPIANLPASLECSHPEREMVSIAALICGYPVVYYFECGVEESKIHNNALAHTPLWILQANMLGKHKHDDHVLFQCTMPSELFPLDCDELEHPHSLKGDSRIKSAREVADTVQTLALSRLDEAEARGWETVWSDVEVTIDGPVTMDRVAL